MPFVKLLFILGIITQFVGCAASTIEKKHYISSYEYTRNQPRQIQNLFIVEEYFPLHFFELHGQLNYFGGYTHWQILFDVVNVEENELDRMKDYISRCRCLNNTVEETEYRISDIQYWPSYFQRNLTVYLEGADAKKFFYRFWDSLDLPFSVPSTQSYIDAFKHSPQKHIEVPAQQP